MYIGPEDKLRNSDYTEDNYSNVLTDVSLLRDRLEIVKNKIRNTPWYRIWTYIILQKELSDIQKKTNKIGKRLEILDKKCINPIQIVKRP
jgi:hypothetical protein